MNVERIKLAPPSAPAGKTAVPENSKKPDNFTAALKDQKQALENSKPKSEPAETRSSRPEPSEPEQVNGEGEDQEALNTWLEHYFPPTHDAGAKADPGNEPAALLAGENTAALEPVQPETVNQDITSAQAALASVLPKALPENSTAPLNKDESAAATPVSMPKLLQAGQATQPGVQTGTRPEDPAEAFKHVLTDVTKTESSIPEVKADFQPMPKLPVENRVEYAAIAKPLTHPGWSEDLGEHILWMNNKAISAAEIKLNPVELGPISVRIDINDDNQASILFAAQHQETREVLESSLPKLRDLLQGQQLHLVNVNVSQHSGSNQNRAFAQNLTGSEGNNGQGQGPESMSAASESGESEPLLSKGLLSLYA